MKYFYKKPSVYFAMYGQIYICDHPAYSRCTLFKIEKKGLAVIQQRYDPETKSTWWTEIDPWLNDDIYMHPLFDEVFDKYAKEREDGLYPTMTIRQIMWALRMKPLPREPWETVFDKRGF